MNVLNIRPTHYSYIQSSCYLVFMNTEYFSHTLAWPSRPRTFGMVTENDSRPEHLKIAAVISARVMNKMKFWGFFFFFFWRGAWWTFIWVVKMCLQPSPAKLAEVSFKLAPSILLPHCSPSMVTQFFICFSQFFGSQLPAAQPLWHSTKQYLRQQLLAYITKKVPFSEDLTSWDAMCWSYSWPVRHQHALYCFAKEWPHNVITNCKGNCIQYMCSVAMSYDRVWVVGL